MAFQLCGRDHSTLTVYNCRRGFLMVSDHLMMKRGTAEIAR